MPELPLLEEARRQFEICNACRYCEGLCAVFPALERRSVFDEGDVTQLANLCHDCRECFYVCPFAPPHEFAVNIPLVMSEVREESYRRFARPAWLAPLMGRRLPAALGLPALLIAGVVLGTITLHGFEGLLQPQAGDGAFYRVIPWLAMVLPALLLSGFAVTVLLWGLLAYWRDTGAQGLLHGVRALAHGTLDVVFLRNLRGGGPGCTHPDERPSIARWVYHMLVFYGFISAFIATVLAAVYQDFFGVLPPYDYLSAPVLFGIAGGIGAIIGCAGLLRLKFASNDDLIAGSLRSMDVAFITDLLLVNVSGMFLVALRETAAMPLLLDVHLGFVAALFITLPYSKFVHAGYRYAALVRNRLEGLREQVARPE